MKYTIIGEIEFEEGTISIADPSYERGTAGMMNSVRIWPGKYICRITTENITSEDGHIIETIKTAQIVRKNDLKLVNANHAWRKFGTISVDTETVGFFQNKPDFKRQQLDILDFRKEPCKTKIWSDKKFKNNPKGFIFAAKDATQCVVRMCTKEKRAYALEVIVS